MPTAEKREFDRQPFRLVDLHPEVRMSFAGLIASAAERPFTLGSQEYVFEPFEGYRSPLRQQHLFTTTKSTKSGPWKSAHQYGLAVDFACRPVGHLIWRWPEDAPWRLLRELSIQFGLDIPIAWDRGHVQHPFWNRIRDAWR